MSVKAVTYYTVVCDWPGCGADSNEGSDYTAWSDQDGALVVVDERDWWPDKDGERHYCTEHPMQRDVDVDEYEAPLTGMHLLIRDAENTVTLCEESS